VDLAGVAERVWYGRDPTARVARAALTPFELLFRGVVAARGRLYDAGALASHAVALPALSVGNLTVGGTGKTPLAAWLVGELLALGAHPALVLRGVGDDEARVHALLNPSAPVIVAPDRVAGVGEARARGADVVVLDDAFQHRRARRDLDLVLASAERTQGRLRLLPAGPFREGPRALRRASALCVTRRTASASEAQQVGERLAAAAPGLPWAVVHLAVDVLRCWRASSESPTTQLGLAALDGARVLAVSGIGDPTAFEAQLAACGAHVVGARHADHHPYTDADAAALAASAQGTDLAVTTFKDAVKLGPRWPRGAPPLWYVSQRVVVERGAAVLDGLLRTLLATRRT
jgi:tetraacyldisaccharide 4'-kinase